MDVIARTTVIVLTLLWYASGTVASVRN
jgi:hypothetical protein